MKVTDPTPPTFFDPRGNTSGSIFFVLILETARLHLAPHEETTYGN